MSERSLPATGGPRQGAGRRGSRSDAMPVPPERSEVPEPRPPRPTLLPGPAPRASRPGWHWASDRSWPLVIGGLVLGSLLARVAAGALYGEGGGIGVGGTVLVATLVALAVRHVLRRSATSPSVAVPAAAPPARAEPPPAPPTDLERGIAAIRRADRGFDPAAFAGYAGMMFRDVQGARGARDADPLRARLTPAMHAELRASCQELRTAGRSVRVGEVDVRARITEAWQDGDQDYVTACVVGSMLSHVVDDTTRTVVSGSPKTAGAVTAFLTFTRPAGLNFWRLSLIQNGRAWPDPGA